MNPLSGPLGVFAGCLAGLAIGLSQGSGAEPSRRETPSAESEVKAKSLVIVDEVGRVRASLTGDGAETNLTSLKVFDDSGRERISLGQDGPRSSLVFGEGDGEWRLRLLWDQSTGAAWLDMRTDSSESPKASINLGVDGRTPALVLEQEGKVVFDALRKQ